MEKQIRKENNPHFVIVQNQNSSSLSKMITTSRLPSVNEDKSKMVNHKEDQMDMQSSNLTNSK